MSSFQCRDIEVGILSEKLLGQHQYHKVCSESNACNLLFRSTTSVADVGGITVEVQPPIFRYILLPCKRWQQWGSLTERHLTQKCRWRCGTEFLCAEIHNNARPHISLKTVNYIAYLGWTALPNDPDLAPFDFHLFRPVKDGLHGQHFPRNNDIVSTVKQCVISTGTDLYQWGMHTLLQHWWKCIANGADNVEK